MIHGDNIEIMMPNVGIALANVGLVLAFFQDQVGGSGDHLPT